MGSQRTDAVVEGMLAPATGVGVGVGALDGGVPAGDGPEVGVDAGEGAESPTHAIETSIAATSRRTPANER